MLYFENTWGIVLVPPNQFYVSDTTSSTLIFPLLVLYPIFSFFYAYFLRMLRSRGHHWHGYFGLCSGLLPPVILNSGFTSLLLCDYSQVISSFLNHVHLKDEVITISTLLELLWGLNIINDAFVYCFIFCIECTQ